ncbi:GLUG motif-containing protein [Serratia sp. DD3]|uniref:two-partner secretion domain-containing protein n=1 Tax=Serratia sp. DD3 TaxID=1410619 RepID=UPI0004D7356C|nr:GLUG motif-containing protein [Serratia sp. DD3]KEY57732.1 heme/hemopexin-binding protein [Serratia sp. DD3]
MKTNKWNKQYFVFNKSTLAILSALTIHSAFAADLPTNGTIKLGTGTITQPSAQQLQINQNTDKLAIDWQSFDIAAGNKVTFQQPKSSSIALNRVVGTNGSQIMGQLSSNGRVFLVNPNGILFGSSAQVNVGGLVASTQDLSTTNFSLGKYNFTSSSSSPNSVTNQGTITATDGGAVVLLGGQVSNQGTIKANLGSVKLGAGKATTLDFAGDGLVNIQVTGSAANALAQNSGVIQADGGEIALTASYANGNVLQNVVNNTGTLQAQTLSNKSGRIVLSGTQQGVVNVSGKLDASAANGGNGGSVDVSGQGVNITSTAVVNTRGTNGDTGTWAITAPQLNVNDSASSNKVSARAVSNNLNNTHVALVSESGDLTVGNDILWSSNNQLMLVADNNIALNANLRAFGNNASLVFAEGGDYVLANGKIVTLSGANARFSNNWQDYTVIHNVDQLQAMGNNLSGYYVLGNAIDASITALWNEGQGFRPVGGDVDNNYVTSKFQGVFSGLGNNIIDLTIRQSTRGNSGLFGYSAGTLRNVNLVGGINESGESYYSAGSLVGTQEGGRISDAHSSMDVSGYNAVGGLIGQTQSVNYIQYTQDINIYNVSASGQVTGSFIVGGLIGQLWGTSLNNAQATGDVFGHSGVGGLIGRAYDSVISDASASGNIEGWNDDMYLAEAGGLVGYNERVTINNAHASGNINGNHLDNNSGSIILGGLVGAAMQTDISNSYATGHVSGGSGSGGSIGGLVGMLWGGAVTNSYANGNVIGGSSVGGLIGSASDSTIINSYATGSVTGSEDVGSLLGLSYEANITNSYATGLVNGAPCADIYCKI